MNNIFPLAACILALNKEGKVLAVARKDNHSSYGLPGGKTDPGETTESAAIRETLEETGYKATNLKHIYSRDCVGEKIFRVDVFSAEVELVQEPGDGEAPCAWVDPIELINGHFGEFIKNLFNTIGINY